MSRRLVDMLGVVFALCLAALAGKTGAQPADLSEAEKLKRHVVAIYDDNDRLLGSGASVSATGLILTAKHILEDRVEGQRSPSYRMSVRLRAQRDTQLRDAQLVATHPHMDIALLSAPEGDLIPPLLVGSPRLGTDQTWFAIGHPRGVSAGSQKMFQTLSGNWSGVQASGGWFVLPHGVDTGMSGGPVILNDRIVGIVSYAARQTYIVPVKAALDYFDLLGFPTSQSGVMRQEDHIGILAGKVQRYEKILSDIQIDRRWICSVDADWPDGGGATMPSRFDLTVANEKRLRLQPEMSARVEMQMSAEIMTGGQTPLEMTGDDVEWTTGENSVAVFDNILSNLRYEIGRMGHAFETAAMGKVDFRLHVSRMSGDGFILDDPGDYAVCCSLTISGENAAPRAGDGTLEWRADARSCPAQTAQNEGSVTDDG